MSDSATSRKAVLMIAYTDYEIDPRVMREAEAAVSGGFDVDFLALRRKDDPPSKMVRGVRLIRLNQVRYRGRGHLRYLLAYLEFFLRCLFKSTWLTLRRRYSIVHVNNMPDFLVFSTILLKLTGTKVILDIHDPMPNTFASKFKSGERGFFFRVLLWQERLSSWYSDRTLTVHEPVKEGILVKHGLAPDSIHVIANFADEELFTLREYPKANDTVRLVFHGTILQRSGLGILMTALSRVRNRDKISARIIGEGDFSVELKTLIESLGLQKVVQFDNRAYPLRQIPDMLAGSNLGLVPLEISSITNYALPLKLLEYVSLGLPVVTVRSTAIGYYFKEEDCLFFDWNNPESLAAVLDRVAENPDLLERYRARVVELRKKFLWSGEKRKYVALLKELSDAA